MRKRLTIIWYLYQLENIDAWIDQGIKYSHRYDQVRDPLDGQIIPLHL